MFKVSNQNIGYLLWHVIKLANSMENPAPAQQEGQTTAQPLTPSPVAQPVTTSESSRSDKPARAGITSNKLPTNKLTGWSQQKGGIKPMIVNPYLARTMG